MSKCACVGRFRDLRPIGGGGEVIGGVAEFAYRGGGTSQDTDRHREWESAVACNLLGDNEGLDVLGDVVAPEAWGASANARCS